VAIVCGCHFFIMNLDPLHQDNTKDERHVLAEKKLGQKFIPSGLKVWQVDPETEKPALVQVKMAIQTEKMLGKSNGQDLSITQTHLKVERNPNLFYCMAINSKNALRKYYKSPFYAQIRSRKKTQ
jgi:hypothetical protein